MEVSEWSYKNLIEGACSLIEKDGYKCRNEASAYIKREEKRITD